VADPIRPARNMVIVSMRGKLTPRKALTRACELAVAGVRPENFPEKLAGPSPSGPKWPNFSRPLVCLRPGHAREWFGTSGGAPHPKILIGLEEK